MTSKKYLIILWLSCIIGSLAVLPFSSFVIQFTGGNLLTLTLRMLLVYIISEMIVWMLLLFFGLKFSKALNIRLLLLENNINSRNNFLKISIGAGLACSLLMLIVDLLMPSAKLTLISLAKSTPPMYGLLASISAINQEVLCRLFLLSAICLALKKIFKPQNINIIMWISIFASALAFGIAHLPTYLQGMISATPLLVSRVIILNMISGITFAYLFWKNSFEAAILSHYVNDIILYVVTPVALLL